MLPLPRYVLEGSIHKAADQLRIGVELVDTTSGTEMWTARYDRPLKDIFAVQDEIVRKVVTTLGLVFKLDQLNVPHWSNLGQPTDNLEAYDDSLRANQYLWRLTKDDNARSRQWSEKAIALAPRYANAYGSLGWSYFFDSYFRWSENPKASMEHSTELAQKALVLDDSHCGALALLTNDDQFQGRFVQAVAEGERAVSINPNCSMGFDFLATALNAVGKPGEALSAIEKAERLDPAGRDFFAGAVGRAYLLMGRYQDAIPALQRHVGAYPNALWAHLDLAIAYTELDRDHDAREEAAEVIRISPHYILLPPEKGLYKDVTLNRRFNDDLRKAGLK
jgi:tetratricopeptide (TPR) repeat protein